MHRLSELEILLAILVLLLAEHAAGEPNSIFLWRTAHPMEVGIFTVYHRGLRGQHDLFSDVADPEHIVQLHDQ